MPQHQTLGVQVAAKTHDHVEPLVHQILRHHIPLVAGDAQRAGILQPLQGQVRIRRGEQRPLDRRQRPYPLEQVLPVLGTGRAEQTVIGPALNPVEHVAPGPDFHDIVKIRAGQYRFHHIGADAGDLIRAVGKLLAGGGGVVWRVVLRENVQPFPGQDTAGQRQQERAQGHPGFPEQGILAGCSDHVHSTILLGNSFRRRRPARAFGVSGQSS